MLNSFSVCRRNSGHWDITTTKEGRIFRIRGGPGKYWVSDERTRVATESKKFKTVELCMAYICSELMYELIIAEGQEPTVIEGWNV